MKEHSDLLKKMLDGDVRSLGRVISAIENSTDQGYEFLKELYQVSGKARVIGVTGPPGAGKSTLVASFAGALRKMEKRVGIVAIDPTSPFSGGALLGDRIRMQKLYTDPGVFIRSMATRGSSGGLAQTTIDVVDAMSAADFDVIIVETIGIGQDEVDVIRAADTVLVVLVPGLGDDIQALKAGMMEIADIFIVNKADREGVDRAVLEIQAMLEMGEKHPWTPPIFQTVALQDQGIDEVLDAIERHTAFLNDTSGGRERRLTQAEFRLTRTLSTSFISRFKGRLEEDGRWKESIKTISRREKDPYSVVNVLLGEVL